MSQLRIAGVADIADVDYAILEQNGQLSVIQKKHCSPPDRDDLKLKPTESGIAHALIIDSKISEYDLKYTGHRPRLAEIAAQTPQNFVVGCRALHSRRRGKGKSGKAPMRAFIFACVIMSVIITIITIDTVYLNDKIDELYDLLYIAQENSSPTSFGELADEWRSCRDIFILSVDDDRHRPRRRRARRRRMRTALK